MKAWLSAAASLFAFAFAGRGAEPDPKGIEFFETKIRPILVENCYECHSVGAKKSKGGLQLDTKAGLLKGGGSGPTLVPGKPDESLLLKVLRHQGETKMPSEDKKLPDAVINDVAKWIAIGAPDPRDDDKNPGKGIDWKEARKFWSFQPIVKPPLPKVQNGAWAKSAVDRFILAKLEEKGLEPVGAAEARTLVRRTSFDLIGLPPTPEEVEAFVKDYAAQPDGAMEKLVDHLLASPHYGERWGRYWLDAARYAEDQAHTFGVKPSTNAWRYRDWVIEAFNRDMPYDRFVKYQIAADAIDEASEAMIPNRAALGFFGLGAQYYKNSDKAKAEADELDDRVDTLTRTFLGLTVSCARCHDHKFDPIPTQDYYSIAGIFWSTKLADLPLAPKEVVAKQAEAQKKVLEAEKKVKEFLQSQKDRIALTEAEKLAPYLLAAWKLEAKRLETPNLAAGEQAKSDQLNAIVLDRFCKFMSRKGSSLAVLEPFVKLMPKKGDKPEPNGEVVRRAEAAREQVKAMLQKPSNDKARSDLFAAFYGEKGIFPITDADARVTLDAAKKQQLVAMEKDVGEVKKAVPPAPPMVHAVADAAPIDLKVYLRGNPAKQGDVAPRRFLRIVAGDEPAKFLKGSGRLELAEAIVDPKNPLTARVMVNRIWQHHFGRGIVGTPSNFGKLGETPTHPELLDYLAACFMESGWSIKRIHREIMLSATYRMSSQPDVKNMTIDADNKWLWHVSRQRLDVESWRDALLAVSDRLDPKEGGPTTNLDQAENSRRTVYAKISRHELSGLLRLFDFPDANIHSSGRTETTVPQQQLFVLNSPFFVLQAKSFAARLQKDAQESESRIQRAYALAFGRPATADEIALGKRYLDTQDSAESAQRNKLTRWERYAQALLASNEFMYVD